MKSLLCWTLLALMALGCNRPKPVAPPTSAPVQVVKPVAKPGIELTDRAFAKLSADLAEVRKEVKGPLFLRVRVTDDGDYKLDLDPTSDPKEDLLSDFRGIAIAIDRKSAGQLPAGITFAPNIVPTGLF